jgi:hypothetical protein
MQQRVLDLEKILEEESVYRRQMQKEREEGRTASALAREYEDKLQALENTLNASNKQVRLLLQQLERVKEDGAANEAKLQKEVKSLHAQLQVRPQSPSSPGRPNLLTCALVLASSSRRSRSIARPRRSSAGSSVFCDHRPYALIIIVIIIIN